MRPMKYGFEFTLAMRISSGFVTVTAPAMAAAGTFIYPLLSNIKGKNVSFLIFYKVGKTDKARCYFVKNITSAPRHTNARAA